MTKKATLVDVSSGYSSAATLNGNFVALNEKFDNTVSLDGSTPNSMAGDLDVGGNDLLNVGSIATTSLTLNGQVVSTTELVINNAEYRRESVTALEADTYFTYTLAQPGTVTVGEYLYINNLSYTVAASGETAPHVLTAGGVKFIPYGKTISPQHFKDNTSPGTTDMTDAIQSAFDTLASSETTALLVFEDGPAGVIDYRGEYCLSLSPVVVGVVDTLGAGYYYNLKITNGIHLCGDAGDWSDLKSDVPGFAFVIADWRGSTDLIEENEIRNRNIVFDETFVIDCDYNTGGRFWENTRDCTARGNVLHIAPNCSGDRTSIGDSSVNARGSRTKNMRLTLSYTSQSNSNYVTKGDPLAYEGVFLGQARATAGALTLNGTEVSSGEWVTPTGEAHKVEVRSTTPYSDGGLRLTIVGFSDVAKTAPVSETMTTRTNSTSSQCSYSTNEYAVITSVTALDGFTGDIGMAASMQSHGIEVYTADCRLVDTVPASGTTWALRVDGFGNVQATNFHPWSREVILGPDCAYSSTFENSFFDSTDLRLYSFNHHIGSSLFTAGDCRIILVATAADEDFEGLSMGPFTVSQTRNSGRSIIDYETEGVGTLVTERNRLFSIAPDVANRDDTDTILAAGKAREFQVRKDGRVEIGRGQATGGGGYFLLTNSSDEIAITPTDGAGDFDYDNQFRSESGVGWRIGAPTINGYGLVMRRGDTDYTYRPAANGMLLTNDVRLIERGTAGTGEWTKWSDGTMIQSFVLDLGNPTTNGAGTWADPYRTNAASLTFPTAFDAEPTSVVLSPRVATSVDLARPMIVTYQAKSTTGLTNVQAFRQGNNTSTSSVFALGVAYGTWS